MSLHFIWTAIQTLGFLIGFAKWTVVGVTLASTSISETIWCDLIRILQRGSGCNVLGFHQWQMTHQPSHNIFDRVKYAHRPINWLTDNVMTVSLERADPPRYHISQCHHEDCQERVAWLPGRVFLLGLGSRCDVADVSKSRQNLKTSQMLKIDVALPNGHAETLTLLTSTTVQDLRTARPRKPLGKSTSNLSLPRIEFWSISSKP